MKPDSILWKSGCVKRWHNNIDRNLRESGDTTGEHAYRVVMLLLMLHPLPSAHLLSCALTHDVPEIVVGDVPGPAKKGQFGDMLNAIEAMTATMFELPVPSDKDKEWVDLCDRLDAYLWVRDNAPYLLQAKEWSDHHADVMQRAEKLGVREKVEAL